MKASTMTKGGPLLLLALLLPAAVVVAFQAPLAAPLSQRAGSSSSSKSRLLARQTDSGSTDDVSRGGFLKSAALALGGGLLATTATNGLVLPQSALAVPASEGPDLTPILLTYEGKPKRFGDIMGKKGTLLVNVASYCALTPQYPALEALYEKYHDQGFEVVGVGCNQFGGQEPEKMEKVRKDMRERYGVQFSLYDKIEVNGGGRHPLYTALFQYEPELSGYPTRISWNFEKFVISADGVPLRRYRPGVEPEELTNDIDMLVKTGKLPAKKPKKSLNDF